jgi:hypothetical protein
MRTRKTNVTVETHQLIIVRGGARLTKEWCTPCGRQAGMVTAGEAAVMGGVSLRTICRRVDLGELHFKETADGLLFICLNSLMK